VVACIRLTMPCSTAVVSVVDALAAAAHSDTVGNGMLVVLDAVVVVVAVAAAAAGQRWRVV